MKNAAARTNGASRRRGAAGAAASEADTASQASKSGRDCAGCVACKAEIFKTSSRSGRRCERGGKRGGAIDRALRAAPSQTACGRGISSRSQRGRRARAYHKDTHNTLAEFRILKANLERPRVLLTTRAFRATKAVLRGEKTSLPHHKGLLLLPKRTPVEAPVRSRAADRPTAAACARAFHTRQTPNKHVWVFSKKREKKVAPKTFAKKGVSPETPRRAGRGACSAACAAASSPPRRSSGAAWVRALEGARPTRASRRRQTPKAPPPASRPSRRASASGRARGRVAQRQAAHSRPRPRRERLESA